MINIWIDAQFSPALSGWLASRFRVTAQSVRDLGMRDADDVEIFNSAKAAGVVVMTKDRDFLDLLDRLGPPPQIVWVTCGNTSNAYLRTLLSSAMPKVLEMLLQRERLVEISDPWTTSD